MRQGVQKRSRNFRSGRKTQANECAQRFSGTARRRWQRRVLPPPPGALGVPQCAHWGGGVVLPLSLRLPCHCEPVTDVTGVAIRLLRLRRGGACPSRRAPPPCHCEPVGSDPLIAPSFKRSGGMWACLPTPWQSAPLRRGRRPRRPASPVSVGEGLSACCALRPRRGGLASLSEGGVAGACAGDGGSPKDSTTPSVCSAQTHIPRRGWRPRQPVPPSPVGAIAESPADPRPCPTSGPPGASAPTQQTDISPRHAPRISIRRRRRHLNFHCSFFILHFRSASPVSRRKNFSLPLLTNISACDILRSRYIGRRYIGRRGR